jgi:hypothetical protein
VWLVGEALAYHTQDPGFHPQACKTKQNKTNPTKTTLPTLYCFNLLKIFSHVPPAIKPSPVCRIAAGPEAASMNNE